MTNPTPPPDRDDAWAKAGSQFNVGTLPKDAININVQGKRVAGPVKGFGALWQKTYTARFVGAKPDPKTVISEWRAHFGDFWPKGNRFFTEGSRVDPGAVAVLNLSPAPGATVVTGIMVLFADDEQFTFLTPEGHMFGGMITFTARVDEVDTVVGLDAGADDYVSKPFRLAELLARVRALLRRTPDVHPPAEAEEVRIDAQGRRAWFRGEELALTAKEFDLLRVLVREQGRVVTREQLMKEIWDTTWYGSTKTLDMHISVLRRKLGDDATQPRHISTVRGLGFRFERPESAAEPG